MFLLGLEKKFSEDAVVPSEDAVKVVGRLGPDRRAPSHNDAPNGEGLQVAVAVSNLSPLPSSTHQMARMDKCA